MKKRKKSCSKKLEKFVKKNEFEIVTWTGRFKELKIIVIFENKIGKRVTKCYEFNNSTMYSHFCKQIRRIYNGSS